MYLLSKIKNKYTILDIYYYAFSSTIANHNMYQPVNLIIKLYRESISINMIEFFKSMCANNLWNMF